MFILTVFKKMGGGGVNNGGIVIGPTLYKCYTNVLCLLGLLIEGPVLSTKISN